MKAPETPWAFSIVTALVVLVAALAVWRKHGPAPLPPDAPADVFSAGRARRVLQGILGGSQAHPVGSAAGAGVRERIVQELRAAGYQPRVQQGFGCNGKGHCAHVRNVVATLSGTDSSRAVLIATHYDSVPAGPGASDDGAGVAAALEVARIIRAGPPPRNSLVLLFDEGEEAGLCGAESFVATDPVAPQVAVVLNLEARGTEGPSLMFESSRDAGWLVSEMARRVARPATSSLFPTIYERLPNNTDLSVFKRAGYAGLNFAWIGGGARYHTPLDDLQHQSPASLQHHGDNLLALARGLLQAPLDGRPSGERVFFDLLQVGMVSWPQTANLPQAILALALVLLALFRWFRAGRLHWRQLLWGLAACPGSLVAAAAVGAVVALVASLPLSSSTTWLAKPWAMWLAVSAGTVATCFTIARLVVRKQGSLAWIASAALMLGVCSLVLALFVAGGSFLTVVGSLAMSSLLAAAALTGRERLQIAAAGAGGLVQAVILLPHALLLYDGVGVRVLPAVALLLAVTLCPWVALFGTCSPSARRTILWGLASAFVMALVTVAVQDRFGPDSPRPMNLVRVDRLDRGQAFLVADPGPTGPDTLPASWRGLQAWSDAPARIIPWLAKPARRVAPLGPSSAAGPRAEITASAPAIAEQEDRQVSLRLRHSEDAAGIALATADAGRIAAIRVNGWTLDPARCTLPSGWLRAQVKSPAPDGVLVQLTVRGSRPVEVTVDEVVFGLPAGAAPLAAERGPSMTPVHDGDRTVRIRTLTL